jgi:hypothetical protein
LDAYKANAAGRVTVASTKVQGVVKNTPDSTGATTTSSGATSTGGKRPTSSSSSTSSSAAVPGSVPAFSAQWIMVGLTSFAGGFIGHLDLFFIERYF